MNLKPETMKKIHEMTFDPDYKPFFDALDDDSIPYDADLLNELVDVFQVEMDLDPVKRGDLMFLARLCFLAGKATKGE